MKSSFHSLIPFSPSLLNHLRLPSPETLNYFSAGLGPSLYSLVAEPTENTASIVIAQQYLNCCLLIRCRGNMFTESLPSNERLLCSAIPALRCHVKILYSET
jgi:hypothetical protein